MENEIWEKVDWVSGQQSYEVSSLGRVRSVERIAKIRGHIIPSKILKQHISRTGYMVVSLNNKTRGVSRIVCTAFHPNPENKPEVNHINGIKTDNSAINLEWATRLENQQHAVKNWLQKSKLKDEDTLFIRDNYATLGSAILSEMFGVCKSYIVGVALGKHRKHLGGVKQIKSNWIGDAPKPIIEYDLNGNEIARYDSASQASKLKGIKLARIKDVLVGGRKHHLGCVYKYVNEGDMLNNPDRRPYRGKPKPKKEKHLSVFRYKTTGEYVDAFYSQLSAAKAVGVNKKGVWKVLNGLQRTAGGYFFKKTDVF